MTDILDFLRRMGQDAGGTASALEILLRVTVLLLAAMLVAIGLRRSSAALRHLVWTLSLVGTLLIPLCYWAFPAWRWSILPRYEPAVTPNVVGRPDRFAIEMGGPSLKESVVSRAIWRIF